MNKCLRLFVALNTNLLNKCSPLHHTAFIYANKNVQTKRPTKGKPPTNNSRNTSGIISLNDGLGGRFRQFKNIKLDEEFDEKRFINKGKSSNLVGEQKLRGGSENGIDQDPEEYIKYEKELDVFARDENAYHQQQVEADIRRRRRVKLAIIKKKMRQLEEGASSAKNYNNLLTWDAKEQIKYGFVSCAYQI